MTLESVRFITGQREDRDLDRDTKVFSLSGQRDRDLELDSESALAYRWSTETSLTSDKDLPSSVLYTSSSRLITCTVVKT